MKKYKAIMLLSVLFIIQGCVSFNNIRDRYQSQIDRFPWRRDRIVETVEPEFPEGAKWVWCRQNIEHWPITINLTHVSVSHQRATTVYDRLQQIPAWNVPGDPNNIHNVNGNVWLIREFRGQWYVGTTEYLRVGQQTKEFPYPVPQYLFEPKVGDRIGFMVSTTARSQDGTIVHGDPNSPYRERSNVLWVTWGDEGIGTRTTQKDTYQDISSIEWIEYAKY